MKNPHRLVIFWSSFLLTLALLPVLFVLAVTYAGTGAGPNPWLQQVIRIKRYIAENTPSPRILLYSGSSGLFGIDCARISDLTGLPAVNLATHAGITFRIYRDEIIKHARPGDIIVMPLEIGHHYTENSDKIFSDLGISMYLGGSFGYMGHLSWKEKYSLYMHYGPGWLESIAGGKHFPLWVSDARLIKGWKRARAARGLSKGYDISSINEYGDMLIDYPVQYAPYQIDRWIIPDHIGADFLKYFGDIQRTAKERGCRLILTYSPLYWYPDYEDFSGPRELLSQHGIRLSGRPEGFHFPHHCYLDTVYHLNRGGAKYFSTELARVICHEAGIPFPLPGEWPHRTFADSWQTDFPGVQEASVYASGVMIADREIVLAVNVPDEFLGRDLYINLLVKHSEKGQELFRSIRVRGTELQKQSREFPARTELELILPGEMNQDKTLEIVFERGSGKAAGFERIHMDLLALTGDGR